jgi:hypothetical protein
MNPDRQIPAGKYRSSYLRLRSFVRTHGVESDVCKHRALALLGFLYFQNFAPLIGAAFGADVMRELPLVAVRALGEPARCQKVVRAALGSAGLGVAPLWVRHCRFLSLPAQISGQELQ